MLQLQPTARSETDRSRLAPSRTDTITRFLMREERLQLVVNELRHRTKNLLAVVQAIARQTGQRSIDLEAFQSQFSQRLSGLSRSMDLLVQHGGQGTAVAELVQSQLESFGPVDGMRIIADGPDLLLNQEATQNIGLALHELATNAMKYGALSVPTGVVAVHWELGPGEYGPACFRLIWREHNGPPVLPPEHRGFGHIVLQRMAGATLRGNVTHDFEASGVSWTLEVAAATILAPEANEGAFPSDRRHGQLCTTRRQAAPQRLGAYGAQTAVVAGETAEH